MQLEKTLNTKIVPIIDRYWYLGLIITVLMFLFSNEQSILAHRLFIVGMVVVFAIHIHFSHTSPLYQRLNQMAIRLTRLSKEYTDFKVMKSFEKDLFDVEITSLKKQLGERGKSHDRLLLEFYGEVYDYLERKADIIRHDKPNTYNILTLALAEVDKDYVKQEEKIKANL